VPAHVLYVVCENYFLQHHATDLKILSPLLQFSLMSYLRFNLILSHCLLYCLLRDLLPLDVLITILKIFAGSMHATSPHLTVFDFTFPLNMKQCHSVLRHYDALTHVTDE